MEVEEHPQSENQNKHKQNTNQKQQLPVDLFIKLKIITETSVI